MRVFVIAFAIFILGNFGIYAKPPKKNNSKKNNRINLSEITITPINEFADYKASRTRAFDLLHTKIEIEPIKSSKTAIGKATLILKPYFYATNELVLDAKYMQINDVSLLQNKQLKHLSYNYDSLQLKIILDKTYSKNDSIIVVIDYVAQPYSIDDSVLDIDGRGMYFINPENKNPYKPFHIWTQGEISANSFWFPTLDSPNERCSQEIFVTVDTAYISLSNGILVSSEFKDDKRVDYWKQDKPHAPYLFFLGIGDYKKYHTQWQNLDVDYYTFKDYFKDVNEVFGNTPEMLTFFSNILKVDFPWDKYSQIIAFDYTAGAMENSSAVVFFDRLLATHQDLIDDNYDYIIAHELFHHWFGDLVTSESWANLTLNESFADYSEYLWTFYKYGKDDAEAYNEKAFNDYLHQSEYKNSPLVNYYYKAHKDMFDAVRYEKGGRILHLLRNYIGDDAFFQALHLYLEQNKFESAEVSDFRKVVEKITGQDWNWFFNQWYFKEGHPKLDIKYSYFPEAKNLEVKITQTQVEKGTSVYNLPAIPLNIYFKDSIVKKEISIKDKITTLYFPAKSKPLFIDFDVYGVLPAEITENLSDAELVEKFTNCNKYIGRSRVLGSLGNKIKGNTLVQNIFLKAIQNSDWNIQNRALSLIDNPTDFLDTELFNTILKDLIYHSPAPKIREKALVLFNKNSPELGFAYAKYVIEEDSSLNCIAAALDIIKSKSYPTAYQYSLKYLDTKNATMLKTVGSILKDTTINHLDFLKKTLWLNNYRNANQNFNNFLDFLNKTTDINIFKDAVAFLVEINQNEESSFNINGANKAINDLKNYLESRKKLPNSVAKLDILNNAIPLLKGENQSLFFH